MEKEKGSLFITAVHFVPQVKIIRRNDGGFIDGISFSRRKRLRNRSAIPRRGGMVRTMENGE